MNLVCFFPRMPKDMQKFSSWLSPDQCREIGVFLSRVIQYLSSGASSPKRINECIVTILKTIGSLLAIQGNGVPNFR